MVDASKLTLEESLAARADISISSDENFRLIVPQRSEPQLNCYYRTEEQGLGYNLIGEQIG